MRRLLALALLLAWPASAQYARNVTAETVNVDGSSSAAVPATCTTAGQVPAFLGSPLALGCPVGLVTTGTGATLSLRSDGSLAMAPRTATLVVAASNASAAEKRGADYVCDGTADEVEIQAAIDALPATGGRVSLSSGTFSTTAAIYTRINLTLSGQGKSTIILAASGASRDMISLHNKNGTNGGRGATAGNNVTISDLALDGNGLSQVLPINIWGYDGRVQNPRVLRCKIGNTIGTSYGILTQYVDDLQVSDSSFYGMGDSLVEMRNTKGAIFAGSVFTAPGAFQTYTDAASGNVVVSGCTFKDVMISFTPNGGVLQGYVFTGNFVSFASTSDGMYPHDVNGITITGNVFDASALTVANGNGLVNFTAGTVPASNAILADNVFKQGAVSAGATGYPAVIVSGAATGTTITGNTIYSAGTTDSTGVKVTGAAVGLVVRNNRFFGAGSGASRVGLDIGAATGVHVEGNTFATLQYGVYIRNTATSTNIVGPLWTTTVTTPVSDAGTGTRYRGVSSLVPTYADNAAALAAGLVAGDPYRTSTGVLMVTY